MVYRLAKIHIQAIIETSKFLKNRGGHSFIRLFIESVNLPAIILVNVIYVTCYVLWLNSKSSVTILLRNYLVEKSLLIIAYSMLHRLQLYFNWDE